MMNQDAANQMGAPLMYVRAEGKSDNVILGFIMVFVAVILGIIVLWLLGVFTRCASTTTTPAGPPPPASVEGLTTTRNTVQLGGVVFTSDPYFVGSPAPVIRGIGCYADQDPDRAMREWVFGSTLTTFDKCQQGAIDKSLKYFGLQNSQVLSTGEEVGVCFGTSDLVSAKKYGTSLQCKPAEGNKETYHTGKEMTNYIYEIS